MPFGFMNTFESGTNFPNINLSYSEKLEIHIPPVSSLVWFIPDDISDDGGKTIDIGFIWVRVGCIAPLCWNTGGGGGNVWGYIIDPCIDLKLLVVP